MASPLNDGLGYRGFQDPNTSGNEFNTLAFIIKRFINRIATATLVQVTSVTNAGGVSPVGFVDIQPLVKQIDGAWNAFAHGIIYQCPYLRMQGGANAIILDPQVGDIGIAIFADRDISIVTANRARPSDERQSPPGSRRRFDMADGLYLGGVLNSTPTQYVQFSSAGITIHSPVAVVLSAPDVQINAETIEIRATTSMSITTPTLTVTADVGITGSLTDNSKNVGSTHTHSGVATGINNTGAPN